MIALLGATVIYLIVGQAAIAAPRTAFTACLKQADSKATSQKVAGDAYEAFVRTTCSAQLETLRSALVGFNLKNGMARRAATEDANMMIDDYLASSIDHYKFMVSTNEPPPNAAAPAPASAPTASATPAQQPKSE
jgi:hypothetical protein